MSNIEPIKSKPEGLSVGDMEELKELIQNQSEELNQQQMAQSGTSVTGGEKGQAASNVVNAANSAIPSMAKNVQG